MGWGDIPDFPTGTPRQRRRRKNVPVSVPYAPTPKGKRAEQQARGHVTIPYAPTPTGKAAEREAATTRPLHISVPQSPELAIRDAALFGMPPDPQLKTLYGKPAYDAAQKARIQHIASEENLGEPEDITHAIELATILSGVGGVAKGLTKAGEEIAAKEIATDATESGSNALVKALTKTAKAPARAAKAVRAAPAAAREGALELASKEGRRRAARAVGAGAVDQAATHSKTLAAVPFAVGNPGGLVSSFAVGNWNAVTQNPLKTGETTGRALAGTVAAPAALLYSAGESAVTGSPKPFEETASTQLSGVKEIVDHLLSSDPATVQKAVESEVGLSILPLLPAVTRAKIYENVRSGIRDAAKSGRKAVSEKTGIPLRYGPGEQNVFGFTERRGARKRVSKMAQRETAPWRMRGTRHAAEIEKEGRKIKGARSLGNVHGIEGGDVAQTLAEYGVTTPEGLRLLREKGPVGETPHQGDVTLRAVLDHLDESPQLLYDKHLQRLLEKYRASAETLPASQAGIGRRAAAGPQGELFGIRAPEDRVPHTAREFTKAEDRAGAWKDLRQAEKEAKAVRTEARKALAQAEVKTGAEAAALKAKAKGLYVVAQKADAEVRAFRKSLDPYTRPGGAVSSAARRKLYDKKMLDEYVNEVNATAGEHGLLPGVYTHHAPLRQEGMVADAATVGNAATRVQHVRKLGEGSLASRDTVDRSLSGLLRGSVIGPRLRAGGHDLARRFFSEESVPLRFGGEVRRRVTQKQFSEAIRSGQISEKHFVWVPERNYKQGFVDTTITPEQIHAGVMEALKGEVIVDSPGAKGVVVPRESFKEYGAQINPTQWVGERFLNAVGKGVSRNLLFSPGWVMSQVFAEGLPILMAHPELLNPAKIAQLSKRLHEFNKLHPEEAMGWAATMGEAPVRIESARDLQPRFTPTHEMFSNGARAIEHNPIGRALFSTARLRPFGLFDQWRHGKYQKVLAAAEADKRFNGFLSGLQGALRTEKGLSDELRKMDPVEQLHALTQPRYRSELDKLERYQEAITGNWTAFTRFERAFSPFTVFYGFMRYAFRWPLTFAKAHPMTATLDYFLAQQNANQIEKLLGDTPADFYQYANPVVQDGEGNSSWLPGGARIAPGLSAPAQGLLSGNAPQAAVSSINPLYGAALGLFTGTDSFGGHDENAGLLGLHYSLAAKQLTSMPTITRFFGIGQSESDIAKELRALDQNRKLRSYALPMLPQSGADARQSNEIIKGIEGDETSGSSSAPWRSSSSSSSGTAPWR